MSSRKKRKENFIIDLHQDILWQLLKGKKVKLPSSFKIVVGSIFTKYPIKGNFYDEDPLKATIRATGLYREWAESQKFILIKTRGDLSKVLRSSQQGVILALEGCEAISDLLIFNSIFELGVRIFILTWNNSNHISASSTEKNDYGLTDFGRKLVDKIWEKGGVVDLAHSSRKTFHHVLKIAEKPVIVSHTGILANPKNKRNISYKEMEILSKNKGCAGLGFGSLFFEKKISPKKCRKITEELIERFPKTVAIGTDLFGLGPKNLIRGLRTPKNFEKFFSDFKGDFLNKNALRVLKKNLPT